MLRNKFFKWGSSSLIGHVILFQVTCAMPLLLFSLATMYLEHTLTVVWALYIAAVCSALVGVVSALVWYTISLPLMKRKRGGS